MDLSKQINTKREERTKLVADARALAERAEKNGWAEDGEEKARWERMISDAQDLGKDIERLESLDRQERELLEKPGATTALGGERAGAAKDEAEARKEMRSAVFSAYLRGGKEEAFEVAARPEFRALQADSATIGGYLVPPEQFVAQLIKDLDNESFIRRFSKKFTVTSSDKLGAPSLDADPANHAWTAEVGAVSEDSTMAFGKRELEPNQLTKLVKVSNKLLRVAALGPENLVRQRLSYIMGQTLEGVYLTGSGASQPLGVFTASANGISTGQDVSTGNTTTAVTFDGLVEAKYAIKQGYNAVWMFSRVAIKNIAKLKDGDGQYLWSPSRTAGEPDRLLGAPVYVSDHANFPQTFTTGLYVGIYGDFSYYWTVDLGSMELIRLNELYQANGQVGFISRGWFDGAPVLENAFARVKLA